MEYKYLFGSKMLKLNNNRDEDWIIFVDAPRETRVERPYKKIGNELFMIKSFINENGEPSFYKACYLFQMSKEFHDANFPIDFNIFDYKDVWIRCLQGYMNNPTIEQKVMAKDYLAKPLYYILYQYNMIIEDTHFISEEAKVDVQKIHDFEMPTSYFYELRDMINSL